MANQDKLVPTQRHHLELVILGRISHQTNINDVAQDIFIHLIGAPILDVNVDRWIAFEKALDERRQVVETDAINRGDADRARNDVFDFLQLVVQRIVSLDDLLAVLVEDLTLARETEFFFAAFDQERFKLLLQRTDLLADR